MDFPGYYEGVRGSWTTTTARVSCYHAHIEFWPRHAVRTSRTQPDQCARLYRRRCPAFNAPGEARNWPATRRTLPTLHAKPGIRASAAGPPPQGARVAIKALFDQGNLRIRPTPPGDSGIRFGVTRTTTVIRRLRCSREPARGSSRPGAAGCVVSEPHAPPVGVRYRGPGPPKTAASPVPQRPGVGRPPPGAAPSAMPASAEQRVQRPRRHGGNCSGGRSSSDHGRGLAQWQNGAVGEQPADQLPGVVEPGGSVSRKACEPPRGGRHPCRY